MHTIQGLAQATDSGWQFMGTLSWLDLSRIAVRMPQDTLGSLLEADVPVCEADGEERLRSRYPVVLAPRGMAWFCPQRGVVQCRQWRVIQGAGAIEAARALTARGEEGWTWVWVRLDAVEAEWEGVDGLLREIADLSRLLASPGAAQLPLSAARAWAQAASAEGAGAWEIAAVIETWLAFRPDWEKALSGAQPNLGQGETIARVWRRSPREWVEALPPTGQSKGKAVDLGF